jgi:hypothetical protein
MSEQVDRYLDGVFHNDDDLKRCCRCKSFANYRVINGIVFEMDYEIGRFVRTNNTAEKPNNCYCRKHFND